MLTCIKDNLGNAIYTVEYINQNQVAKITDAEGSETYYLYKITSNGDLVVYESDSEIVLDEMDSESHPTNNTYNPFEQIIVDSDKLMYTYNEDGTVSEINGESSDKTLVTYSYDENGNVVIITTTDEKQRLTEESTYTYSYFEGTANIQSVTEIIVTNTYDDEKNTTETDSQTITSTYDSAGNLLSERIVHNDDDNTVTYTYGDNGLLLSETADGVITEYTYDANGYVTNIKTIENGIEKNTSYSYNIIGLVLTKTENGLTHNNYYDNYWNLTQTKFDIYTINYIDNGIDSIYVNDTALISYGYSTNKLDSETYANGQSLLYNYDDNGNVIEVFASSKTDENKLFSYTYSQVPEDSEEEQKLLSVIDYKNNLRADYTYTPYGEADEDGNQDESVTSTVYDISGETDNLLYTYSSSPDGESLTFSDSNITNQFSEETLYSNVTDEQTGEVTQEESGTRATTSLQTNQDSEYSNINTTDADGALTNKEIKYGSSTIYYTNYTYDEDNRISFEESNGSGLSYAYDDNENITVISNGNNTVEYIYDEQNQLIRANDQFNNKTYVYEYDSRGNILSKKEYLYTTQTDLSQLTPSKNDSYTYYANEGKNWCDELSTFNGNNLIYDEVGNLTSYNGYTYTWVNGRQLAEISNGTNTYSYTYNDNGIRISKTINGVTTNYITNDGTILSEYNDRYSINYWYDEIGNPVGFIYKDKTLENSEEQVYIYTRNRQGDITGILDNTGILVTQYVYDAWGNITNILGTLSATIGTINGLRYRGYYYDNETGYYYLQSRYYNPEFSRFINADDLKYINNKVSEKINLFFYCDNDGVNYIDPMGTDRYATWVIDIVSFGFLDKRRCCYAMNAYMQGNVFYNEKFTEKLYNKVKKWWAKNGKYSKIKKYGKITLFNTSTNKNEKFNFDKYDTDILAFANYMQYYYKYKYNVNYIKAMLVVESNMGFGKQQNNGNRDIMQCLDANNPAVYCMAKIEPPANLQVGYNEFEGTAYGIPVKGFGKLHALFNKKRVLKKEKVTTETSICFGVFWLGYKTKLYDNDISKGIEAYNGGGDLNYYSKVKRCHNNPTDFLTKR